LHFLSKDPENLQKSEKNDIFGVIKS
jgi:hypothetical protein